MNAFTATINRYVVLAQTTPPTTAASNPNVLPQAPAISGLPGGPVGTTITVGLLFLLLVIAFVAVKAYKAKVGPMILGVCIGTVGATGFVGALAWALVGVIVKIVTSLSSSFS